MCLHRFEIFYEWSNEEWTFSEKFLLSHTYFRKETFKLSGIVGLPTLIKIYIRIVLFDLLQCWIGILVLSISANYMNVCQQARAFCVLGVLGPAWVKHYCMYTKENKILTMLPYTQTDGKLVSEICLFLFNSVSFQYLWGKLKMKSWSFI